MVDLKEKLYQMFILGTGEYCEKAFAKRAWRCDFFTKDIQSAEQFKNLICKFKSIAKFPPFLSIDQEGGRVERTENIHNGKNFYQHDMRLKRVKSFLLNKPQKLHEN